MARHTGGWVKLWRKAALGDINSNFIRGGLFNAVISMANIQPSTVEWKGKPKKLKRGELVTSLKELSDLGEVDPKTVKKHLSYLSLRETLSIEKSHGGLLIKINNYETYQGQDAEGSEVDPKSLANGIPNEWIHNEELKNKRKKEVGDSSKKILRISSAKRQDLSFNEDFREFQKLCVEEKLTAPSFNNLLPEIFEAFGSLDAIKFFAKGVKASKGYKEIREDAAKAKYLMGAFYKEVEAAQNPTGGDAA